MDNSNSSVRVEKVFGLDEEKLKFKVIVGKQFNQLDKGNYTFNLPFLTDDTNSDKYSNAIIKLDCITMRCESNVAIPNDNPIWTRDGAGGAGLEALGSVVLVMDLPSRQTTRHSTQIGGGFDDENQFNYKYNELIPLRNYFMGNYQGIEPAPAVPVAGPGAVAGNSYGYIWSPNNEGVMCANPFGKEIKYYFNTPSDPQQPLKIYLGQLGDANDLDYTNISMQFSITLIPNNVVKRY